MAKTLERYSRESCSYKELYFLLKHIARLVAIPFPEVPVPTYSQAEMVAVPTDPEILSWIQAAPEPVAWYFGMMATYGLRPHEMSPPL
jgi:antitoxin component HigA of HigAB toxin-antitoxin module